MINALDRLDRLDLVDDVVDERGLHALAREGKLSGLPDGTIEIEESLRVQVYPRKEG